MSNSTSNRNRWMVPAPKPFLRRATEFLQQGEVWARVGIGALTAMILWGVMFGWSPPFSYRVREAPLRDLHARTEFEFKDYERTDDLRDEARRNFLCLYAHDQLAIEQVRQALIDNVFEIKQKTFDEISDSAVWEKFVSDEALGKAEGVTSEDWYNRFRQALEGDETLEGLKRSLEKAFINVDKFGLLESLEHEIGELKLKISGCINACGHHHVGHIGILGLDRAGVESYQITLGGDATETATVGERAGPGFSADDIVPAIERIVQAYLEHRESPEEIFLETYRRLGMAPFKAALYPEKESAHAA